MKPMRRPSSAGGSPTTGSVASVTPMLMAFVRDTVAHVPATAPLRADALVGERAVLSALARAM